MCIVLQNSKVMDWTYWRELCTKERAEVIMDTIQTHIQTGYILQ